LILTRSGRLFRNLGLVTTGAGCLLGLWPAFQGLTAGARYSIAAGSLLGRPIHFAMDPLSAFFLLPIFIIGLLGKLYGAGYLNDRSRALGIAVNGFFYNLLLVSMLFLVYADEMIGFFFSWEIMALASFFLVLYDSHKETTRRAAYIYFAFTQFGGLLVLAGFGLIFSQTGSFGFEAMAGLPEGIKIPVFLMLIIGFGSKAGLFPLHIWLPYAHPAAPSHVSAIMSGVMIKMGIYGIIRFYALLSFESLPMGYLILVLGVSSGIYGIIQALGQQQLKKLLAYSSVENIGIILIGLGIGMIGRSIEQPLMALLGFSGALLHVMNHALFKSLLFMGAGSVIHQTGIDLIDQMGGLLKKMRITGIGFLIGALAIAGLPPFNGFIGEFMIYYGGFQGIQFSRAGLVAASLAILSLALIGGLSLACFTKVVGIVFLGEPRQQVAKPVHESGAAMKIPMLALALACLLLGLLPSLAVKWAISAAGAVSGTPQGLMPSGFQTIIRNISLAVLLFGVLVFGLWGVRTLLYRRKTISVSSTWGCGYSLASSRIQYTGSSYVDSILQFFRPVIPAEVYHQQIDSHFPLKTHYHSETHDGVETVLQRLILNPIFFILDRLRWVQHGDIHLYIGYILLAVVALLIFI